MHRELYRRTGLLLFGCALAGCGSATVAPPAPGPAPLTELDRVAAKTGVLASPDYAAARAMLARATALPADAKALGNLRAFVLQDGGAIEAMDTAELIRYVRKSAAETADVQP